MKSIVLPGQAVTGPCETCQRFMPSTWNYGPFPLENGLVVEQVMRATCNQCGSITTLAHQSAHLLRLALDQLKQRRTTLRLPQPLRDYIDLQLDRAGASPGQAELFLRALLAACRDREEAVGGALKDLDDPVLSQPCTEVVTLSLREPVRLTLERLKNASQLGNTSELIRRLLVLSDTQELLHLQQDAERFVAAMA